MFADDVHAGQHGQHGIIVLAGGQEPQRTGRCIGHEQVAAETERGQVVVHDPVAEDNDLLAAQPFHGADRRRTLAGKDGVVDNRMRRGEGNRLGAIIRIGDPLEHIHGPVHQGIAHLGPAAEAEFDLHPHHVGDGPGQLHIVTGRFVVLVEEFVGGIVAVATDHDGGWRRRIGFKRRGPDRAGPEQQQERDGVADRQDSGFDVRSWCDHMLSPG